jgi:hypothetical protein
MRSCRESLGNRGCEGLWGTPLPPEYQTTSGRAWSTRNLWEGAYAGTSAVPGLASGACPGGRHDAFCSCTSLPASPLLWRRLRSSRLKRSTGRNSADCTPASRRMIRGCPIGGARWTTWPGGLTFQDGAGAHRSRGAITCSSRVQGPSVASPRRAPGAQIERPVTKREQALR